MGLEQHAALGGAKKGMGEMELRDYQKEGLRKVQDALDDGKNAIYVLPTGGGKSHIIAALVKHYSNAGKRILICVHRVELLKQISHTLGQFGVEHGVIYRTEYCADAVAVASIQTLVHKRTAYKYDLIVFDEAHHSAANTWIKIKDLFPDARICGFTGTPIRNDRRGLAGMFDVLIEGPKAKDLIASGHLSQLRLWSWPVVDLTGVRTFAGDFNRKQVAEMLDNRTICGDVIDHYNRHCAGKKAIAFCCTVEHAKNVAKQFTQNKIPAKPIYGLLTEGQRNILVDDFVHGRIKVLTSCDLISEGFDVPSASVGIMLRPTKSLIVHMQQCGRVMRINGGNNYGYILDHVGNCLRHGDPQATRIWTLDRGVDVETENLMMRCKKCGALDDNGLLECPECETEYEYKIEHVDAYLRLYGDKNLPTLERMAIALNTRKAWAAYYRVAVKVGA